MSTSNRKTPLRGSNCQNCGVFRVVGRNGRLPPHKCAPPRQVFGSSAQRKIIIITDDGLAGAIRAICGRGL